MQNNEEISVLRFAVPVFIESAVTNLTGIVFSMVIGGISGSALAAVGTSNQLITFLFCIFSMLTSGGAVLVARSVGARNYEKTSRTVEQCIALAIVASILMTALVIAFAKPVTRMLVPNAEERLFNETAMYMRVVMLSLPFMVVHGVLAGILRGQGNSRNTMAIAIGMNFVLLGGSWLFLRVLRMDMLGAGLTYIVARAVAAVAAAFMVLRHRRDYHVRLGRLLKPDLDIVREILHIGLPMTMESASVQAGYVVVNSMTVGLGTQAASVYQIICSMTTFPGIIHNLCLNMAMTIVGQHIGARRYAQARKSSAQVFTFCVAMSTALGVLLAVFGRQLAMLYTRDAEVARITGINAWTLILFMLAAGGINSLDPALKAGGASKMVMLYTVGCVWLLRLPLTYLFAYVFRMGVLGVNLANDVNLLGRMICGILIWRRNKWIHETI